MTFAAVYLLVIFNANLYIYAATADAPSKGDRGDAVTSDSVSSTASRDLIREATGWERPTYGTQTFYPPSGNNKGFSRTSSAGYQGQGQAQAQTQAQGNRKGYPSYGGNPGYGGYGNQGVYGTQNRGGYVVNQPGYGNNKGWSSTNTEWGGNSRRPWSPSSGGNYKGSSGTNQGWYGGQNSYGGQTGYAGGWYGGNQIRPSSGGYNWPPSSGYRGEKGYSGSYGGNNWGYGNQGGGYGNQGGGYGNQGGGYGNQVGGYGNQGGGYGGGYVSQGSNKGVGNQIYGSGYGGGYGGAGQKPWNSPSYGNAIPSQGGWGYNTWDNSGYQGYNKGVSSPRINTAESKGWADTRSGYVNYPNNKGWW